MRVSAHSPEQYGAVAFHPRVHAVSRGEAGGGGGAGGVQGGSPSGGGRDPADRDPSTAAPLPAAPPSPKNGLGILTLGGVNTFTGGTLRILADSGLGAAASPVTIDTAATLQAGGPITKRRRVRRSRRGARARRARPAPRQRAWPARPPLAEAVGTALRAVRGERSETEGRDVATSASLRFPFRSFGKIPLIPFPPFAECPNLDSETIFSACPNSRSFSRVNPPPQK